MSQAVMLNQLKQLENPDGRISLEATRGGHLLERYAISMRGIVAGDSDYWVRCFWEVPQNGKRWRFYQSTVDRLQHFGGKEHIINWSTSGKGMLRPGTKNEAYGRPGIAMGQMRNLPATLFEGDLYDNNTGVVVPKDPAHLAAIWCFCSSPEFNIAVRRIDQKLSVTNATLVKVPFDLEHWRRVSEERYPDGLPEPHSDDPTQWLFRGDIPSSTDPLQVAVAKLLGYRWPDQPKEPLYAHADEDGIVTLAPLVNQGGIAGRLRSLLQAAYESEPQARPKGAPESNESRVWNEGVIPGLLIRAGCAGMSLEDWLRDKFFDAHTKLFQQRPFIWHISDGLKDGFHAYVNYHKLDKKNLERLTHVYLGEWIERQKAAADSGDRTADGRLGAAQELQRKLELIRLGEPPYDIFVRWKQLHEQPLGWEPDLNDGVRMNIRPFVEAGILRGRVNVNWNKDRGKDPKPNLSGTVERHNNLHFTLAQKLEARELEKERRKPS